MARRASPTRTAPDAKTRICVLYGTEAMVLRLHFEALRAALEAEHGEVDTIQFEGQNAPLADVLDELRSLALLQRHKLVVVDAADRFITAHREAMHRYAQNPVDQATLVLRSERWNRGKLDRAIEEVGCIIKCDPLPPARAQSWLIERSRDQYQRTLTPRAAGLLIDRLGCGLTKLDSELAKLTAMVGADESIESEHVDQVVGRSSDEQAWAVQEAVLTSFSRAGVPSRVAEGGRGSSRQSAGGVVIEKIHELVDQSGQPDVLVAYFVADLIRKVHLGLMMKRRGCGDQQIAGRFKLWGQRRGLFLGFLNRLNEQQAGRLFDQMIRYDARAKSGRGRPVRNLECFCSALAEELK